jgi:nucleoside-diphosphate-sugar epimerase
VTPAPIAVVGATGFVGRHVAAALRTLGHPVRRLGRTGAPAGTIVVDVADESSLAAALTGCGGAVWCVSHLGRDEGEQHAVNARGATLFARAASAAGVARLVSVSTAAVYGAGPHRGADPRLLVPAPDSARSRSRLAGDEAVVGEGGTVLRPVFTYGPGDRWFLPALASIPAGTFSEAEADALLSVVFVRDLARVVARVATSPDEPARDSWVVAAPEPVTLRDVLDAVAPFAAGSVAAGAVADGSRAPALRSLSAHERGLLTSGTWYDVRHLWDKLGLEAPAAALELRAEDLRWYRRAAVERR